MEPLALEVSRSIIFHSNRRFHFPCVQYVGTPLANLILAFCIVLLIDWLLYGTSAQKGY